MATTTIHNLLQPYNYYNHLQSITITFTLICIHLQQLLQSITITSMTIHNKFDNQIQQHCNKILGIMHNGLSTEAEELLTKVRATTLLLSK